MDIRKVKKLMELLEESGMAEIEIVALINIGQMHFCKSNICC
jgi:hypothetical protein